MSHWASRTPFAFPPYDPGRHPDYVTFNTGDACQSKVGRIGGQQFIVLTPDCALPQAIHEIGHAVGFKHEHQRPDRDNFVSYHSENVADDTYKDYFEKLTAGDHILISPYDFLSVMHYGDRYFAKPDTQTLTVMRGYGYMNSDIGSRLSLSYWDLSGANVASGREPLGDVMPVLLRKP